jgi:hypothetical protein
MLGVINRQVSMGMTRNVKHLEVPIVSEPDSFPTAECEVHPLWLASLSTGFRVKGDIVLRSQKVVTQIEKGPRILHEKMICLATGKVSFG